MASDSIPDDRPTALSVIPSVVVEEAPSHDGTPCLSVWEDHKAVDSQYDKCASNGRPKYSIQFYDTTPASRDPEHLKAVGERIHSATLDTRGMDGDNEHEDRLDVWGMAMPAETPDEERVNRCVAHMKAEIVARNLTGSSDFFIPGTFNYHSYRRVLIIINGTMEEWEWPAEDESGDEDESDEDEDEDDDDGPFWVVSWGLPEEECEKRQRKGEEVVDPRVVRIKPKELADYLLQEVKARARFFFQSYLGGNLIHEEIARYVKRKAAHERGEVDWDALPDNEGLLGIEMDNSSHRRRKGRRSRSEVDEAAAGVGALEIESGSEAEAGGSENGA